MLQEAAIGKSIGNAPAQFFLQRNVELHVSSLPCQPAKVDSEQRTTPP